MVQLRAMFGDALLQAHRGLLRDLQSLQAVTATAGVDRPADLAGRLEATRALLAEHFAFEEENGYLSSVVTVHPHLTRLVQRLAQEHRDLLHALDELQDETRTAPEVSGILLEKVKTWVRDVRRHEQHEDALVQDAFIVDLTADY